MLGDVDRRARVVANVATTLREYAHAIPLDDHDTVATLYGV
ncbi:hypothetical protein [Prauserella alba]|nr:hypothetical protein [Prauserella alba]MCP2182196.1 hypothetical protein [Prauserella alba]